MVRPQRSDRTIRLRELARELSDAEWPEEEKTSPVIVQVMPQKQEESKIVEQSGEAFAKAAGSVKTWHQVAFAAIIAAVAIAWILTRH